MKKQPNVSPLLELLEQRWRDVIQHIHDPSSEHPAARPWVPARSALEDNILIAARWRASSDNSDPFAYGRAVRYMRQGYELPSDVYADALRVTRARQSEPKVPWKTAA